MAKPEVTIMQAMLTNKFLRALPDQEFTRLVPLLAPVSLSVDECLSRPGEATSVLYFPEDSVLSWNADMQDGRSVEVGMIGREGVAGLPALLGGRSQQPVQQSLTVAVAGSALKVRTADFEPEFRRSNALRQLLLSYTGEYVVQVSQRFACAVLHRMEQRFAVWLLLLADRTGADEAIEITQERIAEHLGVRRAGVSVLAAELQARGIIGCARGSLRINDREALASVACECYAAMSSSPHQTSYQ
jgi:CRP-like cAMP-binding protein